jgi:hypothetical protein
MKRSIVFFSLLFILQSCLNNTSTKKKTIVYDFLREQNGDTITVFRFKNGNLHGRKKYINGSLIVGETYNKNGSICQRIDFNIDGSPLYQRSVVLFKQKGKCLYFRNYAFDLAFEAYEISDPDRKKDVFRASTIWLDTLAVSKKGPWSCINIGKILSRKKKAHILLTYLDRIDKNHEVIMDEYVYISNDYEVDKYNLQGCW